MTFDEKLEHFRAVMEEQRNERTERLNTILNEVARQQGRRGYEEIELEGGARRFIRVISNNGTQRSICYFVEIETGNIYGARSYRAYNPARMFGTLDTVDEWYWGEFYGVSKTGKSTLVPKSQRV